MVVAGQGVGGSQCLSLLRRPDSQGTSHSSAIYVLPRRLTLVDGAQRVSLKFAPPAYLGPDHGSLFFGQAYLGSGTRNSIDFQAFSFNGVSGPLPNDPLEFKVRAYRGGAFGNIDGGDLGTFAPGGGFCELIFDIAADWSQITNTLVTPSGDRRTAVQPHDPQFAIEWLMLDGSTDWPEFGIYADPVLVDDVSLPDISATVVRSPRSHTARPGWTVTFDGTTDGTPPLAHQWYFYETPLPGETGLSLTIPDVGVDKAGRYQIRVENAFSTAASAAATLAVADLPAREAGTVIAWGDNSYGQTNVPAGLNAQQVSVGGFHCLALRADGTVAAWGDNSGGQTDVPAGLGDVTAVAAGFMHSMAIRRDGTLVTWGLSGDLRTQFPPETTNVLSAAAGWSESVAAISDGRIMVGLNSFPPSISGNAIQVAVGDAHGLALTDAGTVLAWGSDGAGQATVPAGLTGVRAIAAGGSHSLALKSDGSVVSWGLPTPVPANVSGATAIAAGAGHSLALLEDGSVVGWGENGSGQITVPPGLNHVLAIAASMNTSAAIFSGEIERPDPAQFTRIGWNNGVLEIDILSEPGWPCRVEFTADFLTWTPIETRTPTQATWTLTDPGADAGPRFYRAVIP
jgi:hypothetical protein